MDGGRFCAVKFTLLSKFWHPLIYWQQVISSALATGIFQRMVKTQVLLLTKHLKPAREFVYNYQPSNWPSQTCFEHNGDLVNSQAKQLVELKHNLTFQ